MWRFQEWDRGGECYPDCPISSLPIIMCKGRLYTHAFFETALVFCFVVFCFVFLFSFNLQYEVAKHTSVTIKKKNRERETETETERERERESKGAWRCD